MKKEITSNSWPIKRFLIFCHYLVKDVFHIFWSIFSYSSFQTFRQSFWNCRNKFGAGFLSSGWTEKALCLALGRRNVVSEVKILSWPASFSFKKGTTHSTENFCTLHYVEFRFANYPICNYWTQKQEICMQGKLLCRYTCLSRFFLGNVSPPELEAIISRFVLPIRSGPTHPQRLQ